MKLIFYRIRLFFYKLFNRKKIKIENEMEEKLKQAIIQKKINKELLKLDILKHFRKQFAYSSRFFRRKGKNNSHLLKEIQLKFGDKMLDSNLIITNDLKFK